MIKTSSNVAEVSDNIRQCISNIDVVVCIGTDKVVCDSLGPLVGSMLNDTMTTPIYVYGLLGSCVTAVNIVSVYDCVKKVHPNSKILAIDAGVGDDSQVGTVQVSANGILPGLATKRELPNIGDVGIVGIVSNRDMAEFYNDTHAQHSLVQHLGNIIVESINNILSA